MQHNQLEPSINNKKKVNRIQDNILKVIVFSLTNWKSLSTFHLFVGSYFHKDIDFHLTHARLSSFFLNSLLSVYIDASLVTVWILIVNSKNEEKQRGEIKTFWTVLNKSYLTMIRLSLLNICFISSVLIIFLLVLYQTQPPPPPLLRYRRQLGPFPGYKECVQARQVAFLHNMLGRHSRVVENILGRLAWTYNLSYHMAQSRRCKGYI